MPGSRELDYPNPHQKSAKIFNVNDDLLLGAGPVNLSVRVQRAIGLPTLPPLATELHEIMEDIKNMARYVLQTQNTLTLAMQTSGGGGNESILTNLLDPGDKLVIAIGGTWGEKILDMAQRHNYDTLPLRKKPGEIYSLAELEAAVVKHKASMLFVTHGESTGGTIQKLEDLGKMCHKHNCLLAVDAVVSIVADPLFVDRWEIDAISAGSQKALGAPAGLCLLSFSKQAEKQMREKKTKPAYYLDVLRTGRFWQCVYEPFEYHITYSSHLLVALREALAEICEEGIDVAIKRHETNAKLFWKRLKEIGLTFFVENEAVRFHGVTCVNVPEDINMLKLLAHLKSEFNIDITPGHGPTLNKAIRIGLLGNNSRPEIVEYLASSLESSISYLRRNKNVAS